MKNIFGKALVALILFYTCTLSAATDEFVAEVIEVDIKTSEITLLYMHMCSIVSSIAMKIHIIEKLDFFIGAGGAILSLPTINIGTHVFNAHIRF